jgi:predicted O-methyltransferase YrrM
LPAGGILEVGAGWGASGSLFAAGNEARGLGEEVWSLDNCEGFQRDWVRRALEPLGVKCRTTDTKTFDEWPALRLAFVDGDHSAAWAWQDVIATSEHVADGGMVLLHDARSGGPAELWLQALTEKSLHFGNRLLHPIEPLIYTTARFRVERI